MGSIKEALKSCNEILEIDPQNIDALINRAETHITNEEFDKGERCDFASKKKKNENCTILIPKGNSDCRLKRSAKSLGLKSHPKDYHQKLTYLVIIMVTIQTQNESDDA